MPQLHRAAQMRKQVIQEPRIHRLERRLMIGPVEADRHRPAAPRGTPYQPRGASHVPPKISIELASHVLGIRDQEAAGPCFRRLEGSAWRMACAVRIVHRSTWR